MREIVISTEVVRLGQYLKLADLVELGSDVKSVLAEGGVRVSGGTGDTRWPAVGPW